MSPREREEYVMRLLKRDGVSLFYEEVKEG
jgi:hypothetical protein